MPLAIELGWMLKAGSEWMPNHCGRLPDACEPIRLGVDSALLLLRIFRPVDVADEYTTIRNDDIANIESGARCGSLYGLVDSLWVLEVE